MQVMKIPICLSNHINRIILAITILITINIQLTWSQTVLEEFNKLANTDTSDLRLLVAYPADVRQNILKTCTHPEAVVRLSDIQKNSAEKFRKAIHNFSKGDQTRIWNLTRYDQLISKLITTKGKTKRIASVLSNYPKEIHADAQWIATEQKEVLSQIESISNAFNLSFNEQQKNYSPESQQALTALLKTPEVISLLNDNMRLTVNLSDLYKKDPITLQQQFDSLSLVVAQERVRERDDLKKAISEDPDAAAELKKSAESYANETGYKESEYKSGNNIQVTEYVYLPYPYRYGYPWWHEYHYWYPYPYWYHWGFYYSGNVMVWISPPSWYFMHWHFHHPHHYLDYPHLTNVYIDHYYYGPRRSHVKNTREVTQFIRRNEKILPEDFKQATHLRADRIREIGQLEIDRTTFIKNNPDQTISKEEFINARPDNYPALKNIFRKENVAPATSPVVKPENQPMELPPSNNTPPARTIPVKPRTPIHQKPSEKAPPASTPGTRTPVIKSTKPPAEHEPVKEPIPPRK